MINISIFVLNSIEKLISEFNESISIINFFEINSIAFGVSEVIFWIKIFFIIISFVERNEK